jgi:hypothetical protein
VYVWLGFDEVGDEVFRDLVIARIVEPTSKIDALRVLADLGATLVSHKTIDRQVRNIPTSPVRDVVAAKCVAHSRDCGGLSLSLYDTTTLHFQAEHEDELRGVGYSKDRRVDPQIVVGLLSNHQDRAGFTERVDDVSTQIVANGVGVPFRSSQQVLQRVRGDRATMLGDRPAILAVQPR